jgi:hypothetical protein
MQTTLAQLIALACHANGACADRSVAVSLSGNSTITFCEQIVFQTSRSRLLRSAVVETCATTPDDWLRFLVAQRCVGARLHWHGNDGDERTAGFVGGGGVWALETLRADGNSAFWRSSWDLGDRNAPAQRIWRVSYVASPWKRMNTGPSPNIEEGAGELRAALHEILVFSRDTQSDPFTQRFQAALRALDGAENGHHRDLAPPGVLEDSEQGVLNACQLAFVFGGMGSWNDQGFEGAAQVKYVRVSRRLYRALSLAIALAVNGFVFRSATQ